MSGFFGIFHGYLTGCVSVVCWFLATKAARDADNAGLEAHRRAIARGNRSGYRAAAWIFTVITGLYAIASIAFSTLSPN